MRTPLPNYQTPTAQTAVASASATDPAVTELFVGTGLSLFGFLLLIILLA